MSEMKHWREAATFQGDVPWTYDGLKVAVLMKISEQLGQMLSLMRCPTVARGYGSMNDLARLAREYWVRPRRKKKAKRASQKSKVRS